jgi:hypothetical protein
MTAFVVLKSGRKDKTYFPVIKRIDLQLFIFRQCLQHLLPLRATTVEEQLKTQKAISVFDALDSIGNFYDKLTTACRRRFRPL